MSVGDMADFLTRLRSLLPGGWFRDSTPVLDSVLSGVSAVFAGVYDLAAYARLQTRIATATDGFLDLISLDYFGDTLPRRSGENDTSFRARIFAELLLERGTRRGVVRALEILTGRTPVVFEPAKAADTGGYGTNSMGYGVAGAYGSLALPFQAFITAYRPSGEGIPNIAGYGDPQGAYGTPGEIMYANLDLIQGAVTDADIYHAIDAAAPAGTVMWTRIQS